MFTIALAQIGKKQSWHLLHYHWLIATLFPFDTLLLHLVIWIETYLPFYIVNKSTILSHDTKLSSWLPLLLLTCFFTTMKYSDATIIQLIKKSNKKLLQHVDRSFWLLSLMKSDIVSEPSKKADRGLKAAKIDLLVRVMEVYNDPQVVMIFIRQRSTMKARPSWTRFHYENCGPRTLKSALD